MAIDLKRFRAKNTLSQEDLSKFLEVSRGFISLVEIGTSKLPDDKIDKLLFQSSANGWDLQDLNPSYTRLLIIIHELAMRGKNITELDIRGQNPFGISPDTICKLRHGKIEITETMAIEICNSFPDVNKEWLLTGNGNPLLVERQYNEIDNDGIPYNYHQDEDSWDTNVLLRKIYRLLQSIDKKMENIR